MIKLMKCKTVDKKDETFVNVYQITKFNKTQFYVSEMGYVDCIQVNFVGGGYCMVDEDINVFIQKIYETLSRSFLDAKL